MREEEEWIEKWNNYNGEKSDHSEDTGQSENPSSLNNFLKNNSELFTIIGAFAAVSFYFVQFDEVAVEEIEVGLVSSLVIFVIVSLVVIRVTLDEFSYAINVGSGFHAASYFVLTFCFIGLMISIYTSLQSYAPSINPTISTIASLAIGIFYLVGVFADEDIVNTEGWSNFEFLVDYASHLAVIIGSVWIYSTYRSIHELINTVEGNVLALTIFLIILHLYLTIFIVGLAVVGEKCLRYGSQIRSRFK